MFCRTNVLKYIYDVPIFIDEEGGSEHSFIFLAYELLRAPDSIQITNLVSLVRQQRELKLKFFLEFHMRLDRIWAYTQNDNIRFFIGGVIIPKIAGFLGATGRIIFGIEIENHILTAKIGKLSRCIRVVKQLKVRRGDTSWDSHTFSPWLCQLHNSQRAMY